MALAALLVAAHAVHAQPVEPVPVPAEPTTPTAPAPSGSGTEGLMMKHVIDPGSPDAAVPPAKISGSHLVLRHRDTSYANIMRGPFQSSRLFSMPLADVVGAFVFTMSGDGSLLQDPGVLTSAGVLALGFGDIAQLEYRHTSAISVTGVNAPVPALGLQLKIPIPEYANVPAFGVAVRLGLPREEQFGVTKVIETVHDIYLVGRLRFEFADWLTLHGGARISAASIDIGQPEVTKRTLVLPTAGYEIVMNDTARIVGEVALAPQFRWARDSTVATIDHGLLGRLGLRWAMLPSVIIDGSIGYQLDVTSGHTQAPASGFDAVVQWDIRLGAEVFVPWGALACRAVGAFCDD
ncbi:MAG: hypothetical protein NT062_38480 [Proteobacteria bacterium]|nr:hypothetical protein [Pseudomonadota bacterium]